MELEINNELFLDTLLMEIRKETIRFSSNRKRTRLAQQQSLLHEVLEAYNLQQIEDDFASHELTKKREELEKIIEHEAEGA